MATAKKSKRATHKRARRSAGSRRASQAAKGTKSEVVYSDVRRDALAWQLSRLR